MSDICSVSGKLANEYCALYDDVSIMQKSFITRTEVPKYKTYDWSYMLYDKTEKCDVHTKAPEEEEPGGEIPITGEVPVITTGDIYRE